MPFNKLEIPDAFDILESQEKQTTNEINDAEVLKLAEDVIGTEGAKAWLRTPNTAFYGDAPADWLHDARRDWVLNTLNAIKYGQYS